MSENARGRSSGPTRMQWLFLFLLCANLACMLPKSAIWEISAAEKGALRLLFFENKPAEEANYDASLEIWAAGASGDSQAAQNIKSLLSEEDKAELSDLCGRCLYHTLRNAVRVHGSGERVFVATGDIEDMWLRDSAVQLGIYLPRLSRHPALRRIMDGAIRMAAFYILQDPYANSFSASWREAEALDPFSRLLGRGGWVATRNYELDSGAYFMNLLWNYYQTPSIFARERFLNESIICDAVSLLVDTWITEQRHEEKSSYRYAELDRNGRGALTSYTGMSWSGFRPSDDAQQFGYNIPVNMYAVGALERVLQLNKAVWQNPLLADKAARLAESMRQGIENFGVVSVDGTVVYAYEVDGLGSALVDFDDPNLPSLLSIPLLGYCHYDEGIYRATVQRLLSKNNSYFFQGAEIEGLGSPHTGPEMVWPLAVMVQALTADTTQEKVRLLQMLLHHMQCGDGLMHESVDVNNLNHCSRPQFEWANAMLVSLYERTLGESCDEAAETLRLQYTAASVKVVENGPHVDAFPPGFDPATPPPLPLNEQEVRGRTDFLGRMVEGVAAWLGPAPPPPALVESRLNPLFFSQLEADIHYQV